MLNFTIFQGEFFGEKVCLYRMILYGDFMSNDYKPMTLYDIKRQDQEWMENDKRAKYELELAQGCLVANTVSLIMYK